MRAKEVSECLASNHSSMDPTWGGTGPQEAKRGKGHPHIGSMARLGLVAQIVPGRSTPAGLRARVLSCGHPAGWNAGMAEKAENPAWQGRL